MEEGVSWISLIEFLFGGTILIIGRFQMKKKWDLCLISWKVWHNWMVEWHTKW